MKLAKNNNYSSKKVYIKKPQATKVVAAKGGGSYFSLKPQSFLGLGGGLGIDQPSSIAATRGSVVGFASLTSGHGGEIAKARQGHILELAQ